MKHLLIFAAVAAVTPICTAASQAEEEPRKAPVPVRDGHVLSGADGVLTKSPDSGTYFFTPEESVTDGRGTIKAGQGIEMLPSAALENITVAMGEADSMNLKLWARITRYSNRNILIDRLPSRKFVNRKRADKSLLDSKFLSENLYDKNYLYAIYFLPLTATDPDKVDEPSEPVKEKQKPDEGETDSILPKDVFEALAPKRVVDLKKATQALEAKTDVMLADRTGFVVINDDEKVFVVDGLGRNVEDLSFELLSCEALEATERSLVEAPIVRQRFRVSGIITSYKGANYMLLQRAIRTYSHGNFSR